MLNKVVWIVFGSITAILLFLFTFQLRILPAGDISEYFGITETILDHAGLNLTPGSQHQLEASYLNPGYFTDPGHYIKGIDGQRYPVHFYFYSLLVIPFRLFLKLFQQNELMSFALTNTVILSLAIFWILKRYIQSSFKRLIFLLLCYLSPFMSFLAWPGPDLLYLSLLLVALFAFFSGELALSAILLALASMHSQPLILLAVAGTGYYIWKHAVVISESGAYRISLSKKILIVLGTIFTILILPYIYNLMTFGVLTPWTIFQDGWTKINGFGLQNASLWKLYEQFFDLNVGLFWYAPFIIVLGLYGLYHAGKVRREVWFVGAAFILSAFFYQTNPAWHYGTAGYGPSRHAIFLLPLFIYFVVHQMRPIRKYFVYIGVAALVQVFILSQNGFITPDFRNTLDHSAFAKYILNYYPAFYSPTPEIFVDRTNHQDVDHPTSAIYLNTGYCTKAYILPADIDSLTASCGYIPIKEKSKLDSLTELKPYEGVYINY